MGIGCLVRVYVLSAVEIILNVQAIRDDGLIGGVVATTIDANRCRPNHKAWTRG